MLYRHNEVYNKAEQPRHVFPCLKCKKAELNKSMNFTIKKIQLKIKKSGVEQKGKKKNKKNKK